MERLFRFWGFALLSAAAGPDGPLLEGSQPSSPEGGRALPSVVGRIVLAGFQAVSLTAELPGRLACRLFC